MAEINDEKIIGMLNEKIKTIEQQQQDFNNSSQSEKILTALKSRASYNTPKISNKYSFIESNSTIKNYNDIYDISTYYPWSLQPKNYKDPVPSIIMTEYELNGTYVLASVRYWAQHLLFNENGDNPYMGLYDASPTGTYFYLPYYTQQYRNTTNQWGEKDGILESLVKGTVGAPYSSLIGTVAGWFAPNFSIDTPYHWQKSQPSSYTITFTLFNTIDPINDIDRNYRFIKKLTYSSLPDKRSPIQSWPPCLYKILIPGVRYSPAATISNLQIDNVGHIEHDFYRGIIIPEAWRISITIQELITESRQLYSSAADNHQQLDAMTSIKETEDDISNRIIENMNNNFEQQKKDITLLRNTLIGTI